MRWAAAICVVASAACADAPASGPATAPPTSTSAVAATLSLAAPSATPTRAPTPADRFGVSFSGNELDANAVGALKALGPGGAGAKWIRIELRWSRIEGRPGQRNYAPYDAVVRAARAEGYEILAMLSYGNANNTSMPTGATPPPSFSHIAGFYPETWAPNDYAAYRSYVGDLAARYKSDIRAWQVWNEPTLYDYWRSGPAEYARLLAETALAVKAKDPAALIVMGGLTFGGPIAMRELNARFADQDFLPRVLTDPAYPGTRYADVIDVHVYSYGKGAMAEPKERVEYTRAELATAGVPDKPIWVGEVGYASDEKGQVDAAYRGPEAQSRWLRDTLSYLTGELRVEKVFWFTLVDTTRAGGDKYATAGLLDAELRPKPALETYKALIGSAR